MSDTVDIDPLVALAKAFPGATCSIVGFNYMAELGDVQVWLSGGDSSDYQHTWITDLAITQSDGVQAEFSAGGPSIECALDALAVQARIEIEEEERNALERYECAKATRERVAKLFP